MSDKTMAILSFVFAVLFVFLAGSGVYGLFCYAAAGVVFAAGVLYLRRGRQSGKLG